MTSSHPARFQPVHVLRNTIELCHRRILRWVSTDVDDLNGHILVKEHLTEHRLPPRHVCRTFGSLGRPNPHRRFSSGQRVRHNKTSLFWLTPILDGIGVA